MNYKVIAVIALTLILGSIGGFYYMHNIKDGEQSVFLPMDEFVVDIITPQSETQNTFLKIKLTLEVEHKRDVDALVMQMPKIRDIINYYIKDLRIDDITGSGGMYYLKREILLRVNKIVSPITIKNILFNEITKS